VQLTQLLLIAKVGYLHLTPLKVYASAVLGCIFCIYVCYPGWSSLFCHVRKSSNCQEADPPNVACTEFSEVRLKGILRSWTSALRSSQKFAYQGRRSFYALSPHVLVPQSSG
jgi:hypothetical protein